MKNAIREYIPLTEKQKKELWKNATFVFDTNILLACYKYTKQTSEEIIKALEKLGDRIWIPKQVAQEFMKNRITFFAKPNDSIRNLQEHVNKLRNVCENRVFRELKPIKTLNNTLKNIVEKVKNEFTDTDNIEKDEVCEQILKLFDGKVGNGFDKEKLKDLDKEFQTRAKNKIPPGYKDYNKEENASGDYILWREIIDFAKQKSCDIILITEDQKEDWFSKEENKTFGPRNELRKEFYEETKHEFYIYTLPSFLLHIRDSNDDIVSAKTIKEVEYNFILDIEENNDVLDYAKKMDAIKLFILNELLENKIRSNNIKTQEFKKKYKSLKQKVLEKEIDEISAKQELELLITALDQIESEYKNLENESLYISENFAKLTEDTNK